MTFVSYWIIGLPIGYYLTFHLGFGGEGVWVGLIIGLTITAIGLLLRFNKLSKTLLT